MMSNQQNLEIPVEARIRAGRESRWVPLFLFALAVILFAVGERWQGPFPLIGYVNYAAAWTGILLPLVILHFRTVRWRLRFFLLFYLCFAVIAAAPHPADPLIHDVARIRHGMPMDEARAILAPHIARGDLELNENMTTFPIINGGTFTGSLWYSSPTLPGLNYVCVRFLHGKTLAAGIGQD